jgi:hypothetical protein
MVLLRTSTIAGYYRHFFTIIATPTVLWRPLIDATSAGTAGGRCSSWLPRSGPSKSKASGGMRVCTRLFGHPSVRPSIHLHDILWTCTCRFQTTMLARLLTSAPIASANLPPRFRELPRAFAEAVSLPRTFRHASAELPRIYNAAADGNVY